jgi:hypothetical protein
MTEQELQQVLTRLTAGWEGECVEFKDANDNFSTSDIGKYFSALANEANLHGLTAAWLVFGVDNRTRCIIGTDYRREKERLHGLKHQIAQGTDPSTSFREIHELNTPSGRVVLFEIPAAPRGLPIAWQTHFYARDGSTLTGLSIAKQDEIRAQSLADDWSAIVCKDATIADLDPDAIAKARDIFIAKFRGRIPEQAIRSWDDTTFLDQAKLTVRMIDTMGFGIREVMWKGQAGRYLPLPDFDLTEPGHVKLRLQGRFMDENYSRALLTHADLPWPDVLALDTIQKGGLPDDALVQDLRHRGLVEGRKPRLHVAADVAAATETEAEYLHPRGFDDAYYCDLIVEYLKKFGSAKRAKFNRLLEGKLSDLLSPAQKRSKINNLLARLQREAKITVDGYGKAGVWKLAGQ